MKEYVKSNFGNAGLSAFEKWADNNLSTKSGMTNWSSVMNDGDMKAAIAQLKLDKVIDDPLKIVGEMPRARDVVVRFTMKEFSAENPIFLSKFNGMPIDEFAADPNGFPNERLSEFPDYKLAHMVTDYVGGGYNSKIGVAEFEVNVSSKQRKQTEAALLNLRDALGTEDADQINQAKKDLLNQLVDCRKEVTKLMKDTMGQLRKEPEFYNALMGAMIRDSNVSEAIKADIIPDFAENDTGPLPDPDFYNKAYEAAKAEYQEQQKALKEAGLVKSGW